jgi:plasmid stabilization system protein ParE
VKHRAVIYSTNAVSDLRNLYDWFASHSGNAAANLYVERVQSTCERLAIGSNRGTLQPDIGSNVRKTGVLGRFTVVFAVERETVLILRIFMAGRDWGTDMEHGTSE